MEIVAAVARAPNDPFTLETLDLDEPRDDEVLVRIVAVGLCHTDLVARAQIIPIPLPAVLGHEGAGIVERIGRAVRKVVVGDRVVLTFDSCGRCPRCDAKQPAYCDHGMALNYSGVRSDGSATLHCAGTPITGSFFGQSSFASHALAHERNVVKVDASAPLELLGPLGCGIQTGAGAVLRSLQCPAGSSILITGAGSVGLSAAMAAVVAGCSLIIVSDPLPERRALALELGATHAIDPTAADLAKAVRAIVGAGCDFALDTSGVPAVMTAMLDCLRARGTLGLVGIPFPPDTPTPGTVFAVLGRGLTIRGIVEGDSEPDEFIPELIALHRDGRFPFDRLITRYRFDQINQAIVDQHDGRCTKAVLVLPDLGALPATRLK